MTKEQLQNSPLSSLLHHCRQSLHGNTLFTLRQLVPVHQTLCQCLLLNETGINGQEPGTTIDTILQIRLGDSVNDKESARKILTQFLDKEESIEASVSAVHDSEQLLILQFLMFPLSLLDALRFVLIPFLLQDEATNNYSEELELALLDWMEIPPLNIIEDSPAWQDTLTSLVTSPNPVSSRILVRLVRRQPDSALLIQAVYDKLWQTIQAVLESPPVCSSIHPSTTFQNHPVLSSLSKDLLPLLTAETITNDQVALTTELHRPHVHQLWTRLFHDVWSQVQSLDLTQRRVAMLVITTTLCPILPHLELVELPLDANKLAQPVNQPALWELTYSCLSQGTSALEEEGMAALSSILRRRGLFILNSIATTNEWKQYVMCYETLEMESEQHLVDQIWESVGDLLDKVRDDDGSFGLLTWNWMSLLFGCVLSASLPVVRKNTMHRLLKAHELSEAGDSTKKGNKQKLKSKRSFTAYKSFLAKLPPDFVLTRLLPSWNSLARSVGFTVHVPLENRSMQRDDMIPMMQRFLQSYLGGLDVTRAEMFWKGLWDWNLQKHFGAKTFVLIFQSLATRLASITSPPLHVPIGNNEIQSLTHTLQSFFILNSVVLTHRREILEAVAVMLAHSLELKADKWNPVAILKLMALYKQEYFSIDSEDWSISNDPVLVNLKAWLSQMEQNVPDISATLASAYVDGQLGLSNSRSWDPEYGGTSSEREMAWGVLLFCSLAADTSISLTTSQLVWPAISKGLSNTAGAVMTNNYIKADHVTRALLLLESGCLLRQLSGLGNGDLVVLDKTTQQLMPPPPNIESMLSSAVDFCLFHIRTLFSIDANEGANGALQTSITYTHLVAQLRTLHQSFPSSQVISTAMDALIQSSFQAVTDGGKNDTHRVMHATLIYAALSSGANITKELYIPLSRAILALTIQGDTRDQSITWEHMGKSILYYSKWASISQILPILGQAMQDASESFQKEANEFIEWILEQAFDAVDAAVLDAIVPVFKCVLEAAKLWISHDTSKQTGSVDFYVDTLEKIVTSLLGLMSGASLSYEGVYMLNQICSLIFQPRLMQEEYNRFKEDSETKMPIRDGFRKLLEMAGTERAHINRAVLCKITIGWLGVDETDKSKLGLNAIPYKDDIVKLLLHKEIRKDESTTNQNRRHQIEGMTIPVETNELSLTRAFVLVFFEKLPDIDDGVNPNVLNDLLEPVILSLLLKAEPIRSTKPSLIMKGTPNYCMKMRAWQALCNLSRFVSPSIAQKACAATFECIEETIHSQIRYFVEIFGVKCGTIHPDVFGNAFLDQIIRTDLTLQQVSSLMIMGGNWIVGSYKIPFFEPSADNNNARLRKVLAGAIPWLSSTQGFSRAIAQLLVYSVIPLVLNTPVDSKSATPSIDDDGILRLIFNFLEENREMARLRRKQSKFFETYDVESVCTAKGVLSIPVDEGDEAEPAHMVDIIKQTLVDVYEEAHGADAPDWKQVEELVASESHRVTDVPSDNGTDPAAMNFQRKIIPLNALNLAMESQRQVKLRNAAGQQKQQLVVCASLVDKVPNLAGLARTAEIFAADRLVIPDKDVVKMDNFQSISVGAGEWIDIEQVRPEGLLSWLLQEKARGYFIVGVEQTASSVSLDSMVFPDRPTILLLGKEKEGIPVELLQAVDQCIEIPQLGIIRSLNVHVSGAIAIWEHTKQRLNRTSGSS